jgi:integrase
LFKVPKVDNQVTEHLTKEEVGKLLAALEKEKDQQAIAIVRLVLLTGMRKGEVLSLEWKNLDLDRLSIRIVDPKGGKSLSLPLSVAAAEELRKLPRSHEIVFPGRNGNKRPDIKRPLERIRKAAGLPPGFRPLHGLRHHFASELASSGEVDLYTLQCLLGHKDPATTMRYAHLRDETLRTATAVAARALKTSNTEEDKDSIGLP